MSTNERSSNSHSNFWRNVATGVGVAAAGAVLAYFVSEALEEPDTTELNTRQPNGGRRPSQRKSPQRNATGQPKKEHKSELRKIISDQLNSATYECATCLEIITNSNKVISCNTCYQIFHQKCYVSYLSFCRNDGKSPLCPTCRRDLGWGTQYKCFCGKKVDPVPAPGLTPHSCGDVCERDGCTLLCHPGPCSDS